MNQSALHFERLDALSRNLPHAALAETRSAAAAHLRQRGVPDTRDEDWKYTDLAAAMALSNRWLENENTAGSGAISKTHIDAAIDGIDANWIIVSNGEIDISRFDNDTGIDVRLFSDAGAPAMQDKPLADLNLALLQDGLRIEIHSATEKPLGLLLLDDTDTLMVTSSNIDISVAAGCDVEIVELQTSSGTGEAYANGIISLQVDDGANVRYVRVQNRDVAHMQTSRIIASLGNDSDLNYASFDLGGKLTRNDVDIDLSAAGANVEFNGLYLVDDGQHVDNHTRVDHRVGPATSTQEYRGILNGRCRAVWNGKAIVHAGADGTDATQGNHNLLLSPHAEINAKPELEIYADDVKCAHGTTVGQLDESALFYLRSRGLDQQHARQVLTHAFAADLVRRVPVDAAAAKVAEMVEARLRTLIPEQAL